MSLADVLQFAGGALRGHRLRAFLSLFGVAIGVASVILLTSLGEGARLYVTGEFASLGSNLLIIIPGKTETKGLAPLVSTAPHDLTQQDAEALLQRVPSIRRVAPLIVGTARASAAERGREVTVVGTTREMLEIRHLKMATGRFLPADLPQAAVCVLGAKVQRELFPNQNPLGQLVRIGDWRFRVIGVIAPRGVSIGMDLDEVVEIPVETGLKLFNRSGLFRILAEVGSYHDVPAAEKAVLQVLRERHGGQEDVTVLTQDTVLASFNLILRALTAALAGIAAISLAVAGLGIMNVMLVSVSERTREIGLLKAVGGTDAQILSVFLVESSILSTVGGALGLFAGLGGGRFLQHLYPDFPIHPPAWAVFAALAVSVLVGLLFGILPARNAARLNPIQALMRRKA
ncbi:MAG: FtsX-like permease family protein [Verrucomicrobia bacterium]|nr:FtsX-like permease family protein [Verrucomicrobiota bacterium]